MLVLGGGVREGGEGVRVGRRAFLGLHPKVGVGGCWCWLGGVEGGWGCCCWLG